MDKIKIYFPSLNGVRAIAVSMVIIHHIEMIKSYMGLSTYSLPGDIGGLGVTLFFVLSGFLITYLLLAEQDQTQTINIKNFYIRRILRIWPLYYLIVIISFFFFSQYIYPEGLMELKKHYWLKFIFNIFLMANVSHACIGKVPLGSNLWSVGTEEQFYLIWPVFIKKFRKRMISFLIIIIAALAILRMSLAPWVYTGELFGIKKAFFFVMQFLNLFRIDCMAMGALAAWILFYKKEKVLNIINNKLLQIIILALCLGSLIFGITYFNTLNHTVYAFFFALIIVNLAGNKNSVISLEWEPVNFIGKISYGLYVYHFIVVVILVKLFANYFSFGNSFFENTILYFLVFLFSILISFISYKYLELPILKLKSRFTNILSGDAVKE